MREDVLNLTDLFYEIWEAGYIYNEPNEYGLDMSYEEYAEVNMMFEQAVVDEILKIDNLEEATQKLEDIMDTAIDDVRIFMAAEDYDNFSYWYDERSGRVYLDSVPDMLEDHFNELAKKYEEEHMYDNEEEYDDEYDLEIA